jgi:two-component system chemotaxis response regulator CheY
MGPVLVVDDDEAVRELVVEAIADAGYSVEQAENGRDALDKMHQTSPCMVVLDLMMPVMDGWQVVVAMEADPGLARVPVCVVTAQDRIPPPKTAALLKKPVSAAKLVETIEMHCGKP